MIKKSQKQLKIHQNCKKFIKKFEKIHRKIEIFSKIENLIKFKSLFKKSNVIVNEEFVKN